MTAIGLLQMPIGNLTSAFNALYHLGFDPIFVNETNDFEPLSHLIVPGVGNFSAVMMHLKARGLDKKIRAFAASNRPTLGICVGMQVLASAGTEGGESEGLDLVQGRVHRLPETKALPLPHVGWSTVEFHRPHPVTESVKQGRDFYFVHSYGMQCVDEHDCIGSTNYGSNFASIVGNQNVIGFQFHPEKSQSNGLQLLENFCHWDGTC